MDQWKLCTQLAQDSLNCSMILLLHCQHSYDGYVSYNMSPHFSIARLISDEYKAQYGMQYIGK